MYGKKIELVIDGTIVDIANVNRARTLKIRRCSHATQDLLFTSHIVQIKLPTYPAPQLKIKRYMEHVKAF